MYLRRFELINAPKHLFSFLTIHVVTTWQHFNLKKVRIYGSQRRILRFSMWAFMPA